MTTQGRELGTRAVAPVRVGLSPGQGDVFRCEGSGAVPPWGQLGKALPCPWSGGRCWGLEAGSAPRCGQPGQALAGSGAMPGEVCGGGTGAHGKAAVKM